MKRIELEQTGKVIILTTFNEYIHSAEKITANQVKIILEE